MQISKRFLENEIKTYCKNKHLMSNTMEFIDKDLYKNPIYIPY